MSAAGFRSTLFLSLLSSPARALFLLYHTSLIFFSCLPGRLAAPASLLSDNGLRVGERERGCVYTRYYTRDCFSCGAPLPLITARAPFLGSSSPIARPDSLSYIGRHLLLGRCIYVTRECASMREGEGTEER